MSTDDHRDGPWRPLRSWEGTPQEVEASFVDLMGESTLTFIAFALSHALQLTRGHEQEAKDLVQYPLEKLYKGLPRPVSNPRGWVTEVITNKYIDNRRRTQTQTRKLGDRAGYDVAVDTAAGDRAEDHPASAAVATATWAEVLEKINAVCEGLGDDQQVVLRALVDTKTGGLRTIAEIMDRTGFEKSKVKRLRAQVMRTLRDALDDPDDQSGAGVPA